MNPLMFRIFPTQSGIVAIMSRQLIRHFMESRVLGTLSRSQFAYAIVLACVGLGLVMTVTDAAEYIVEDRQASVPAPRIRMPRNAPDPSQLASESLSFDGLVGEPSTRSILQPIAEDSEDESSWSTGGASVAVIDDADTGQADTLESEWVVSGDPYAQPLRNDSSAWDWTHGLNTWSSTCDAAYEQMKCGHKNLLHACKKGCRCCGPGCWTGRADAVMLWRSAPYSRTLVTDTNAKAPVTLLDADQLESGMAAGPRVHLFRSDGCGNAFEFGYLGAWSFQSERVFPDTGAIGYVADLIGSGLQPFEQGDLNLTSSIQTIEINSRTPMAAGNVQFICGVRWLEWTESFSLTGTRPVGGGTQTDAWSSRTVNNLYGGQIGIDALLYSNSWLRVESLLKGGAYWNDALSRRSFKIDGIGNETSAYDTPSPAAFVGELGFTGVLPLRSNLDFRFGYLVFWLEGIAQPTQQLSQPVSTTGDPLVLQNSGTVVQGLTLGLEGCW